ncbi:MAG: rhomboid family intramembrane serine protease [Desulfurococcales archaeon]|nr:rhomboid family intramembrane serine protease [Desulfurococcales archaeon]
MSNEYEERVEGWLPVWKALACELKDTSPPGDFWLTKVIILLNIALFGVLLIYLNESLKALHVTRALALVPCVANGTCIPSILLSMFAHGGILHLLGNMFFLYIVGDNVELTLGRARYLVIYLAAGIYGALVESVIDLGIHPLNPSIYLIGASAGISGLIGAYLVLYPGSAMCYCVGVNLLYRCFRINASNYVALWIIFQLIYALFARWIVIWAHLAGLLIGAALAYLLADLDRINELRRILARGRFRGLKLYPWELRYPSMGTTVKILFLAVVVLLSMLTCVAAEHSLKLDGKYYTVYALVTHTRYCNEDSCWDDYNLKDLRIEITDTPPSKRILGQQPADYTGSKSFVFITSKVVFRRQELIPIMVERLDYVAEVAVSVVAASVLVSILALHAVLNKSRLVEVTYVPEDMLRDSRGLESES